MIIISEDNLATSNDVSVENLATSNDVSLDNLATSNDVCRKQSLYFLGCF